MYSGRLAVVIPRGGKMAKIFKRQKQNYEAYDAKKLYDLGSYRRFEGFKPAKFDETLKSTLN